MDVYHKVLTKVFEETGGRETVEVDLVDLLKREGFFPSLESIDSTLKSEGWATVGSSSTKIRITHWGVAEAKRVLADKPDKDQLVAKESSRLLNDARELVIMLEELNAGPNKKKLETVEKRTSDIVAAIERLKLSM